MRKQINSDCYNFKLLLKRIVSIFKQNFKVLSVSLILCGTKNNVRKKREENGGNSYIAKPKLEELARTFQRFFKNSCANDTH